MHALQILTFMLGLCATALSSSLCVYFSRSVQPIGRSVAFMLLGESISGAVTVVFSGNSLWNTFRGSESHLWNTISPEAAIVMRWLMFFAMGASSIHLTIAVRKILREKESEDGDHSKP